MTHVKGEELTIFIDDVGMDGEGIGKYEGFTVFVKDALPGEQVFVRLMKVKKSYGYGKLVKVLLPSPFRVEPPCPLARPCGGCQIQALSYQKQLSFKMEKVRGNLSRLGGVSFEKAVLEPILGMEDPWRYRNKTQFPVGTDKEGRPVAGLFAGRTHSIIPVKDCLLGPEVNGEILQEVLSYMRDEKVSAYEEETGKGLIRHILVREAFETGELLICLVVNGSSLPKEEQLCERLQKIPGVVGVCLNENTSRTNVILGEKVRVLWGRGYVEDVLCSLRFRISPLSFYQVNHAQTERLYAKALSYAGLTGCEEVWDLYCGIGTISLLLAQKAGHVTGVEVVEAAIADAKENATRNGISNATFLCGKAQDVFPAEYERTGKKADVIVVDPPRKGCDREVLSTMAAMEPKRIVYVSCDSATLGRDIAILREYGYEVEKACPVDMFPHSVHVETVVLLTRNT